MAGMFWSNTIWYLMLFASSIAAVAVTVIKSRKRGLTVAFMFAALGFTYWIEAVLLLVLNAYEYYPLIIPKDHFQDMVLGNIFSQVSVSTTAVLYSVLDLKSIYLFVFAGVYFLIDALFSQLGIYVHHWFRSIYTLLGYIPYCWIIKKWYVSLTTPKAPVQKSSGFSSTKMLYYITLFLAVFAASANSLFTTQKIAGLQIFKAGIFSDSTKDHTTATLIYGPIIIVIMMALCMLVKKRHIKIIVFLALFVFNWLLHQFGSLYIKPGWFLFVSALDLFGIYFWTLLFIRLFKTRYSPPP